MGFITSCLLRMATVGRGCLTLSLASMVGLMAIETKAGKGTTTALQERELDLIRKSGGVAMVINEENIHELQQYLASFDEGGSGDDNVDK